MPNHHRNRTLLLCAGLALLGLHSEGAETPGRRSEWVFPGADGRLVYKALPAGDRIMDFSFAGYRGGGAALPEAPVRKTLRPSGGDDTAAIQAALDEVARGPAVNGLRGAVLLEPGRYHTTATLQLRASGVVLRGSGSGAGGTTVELTGKPRAGIFLGGSGKWRATGPAVAVTDAYVPSGATSFRVANATAFKPGDAILVHHPATDAWVRFMGMAGLTRNGKKEHWVSGEITARRVVTAVQGERLTVDVPLSDSLDARYLEPPGAWVTKCTDDAPVTQAGVEHLRMEAPPQKVAIDEPHYSGVQTGAAADIWLRDLALVNMVGSVALGEETRRATVVQVDMTHTAPTKGAAKPADLALDGTQILVDRCTGRGDNLFYAVTGARVTGPNVLLNCTFHGDGHVQPHQRWATGLLVDGCRVPESGIDFMNRGEMGSGHGWTMGWAVAWNCQARSFTIQQPPGAVNWAIGCTGERETAAMPFGKGPRLPEGIFDAHGGPVAPASLYLAQLRERLGVQAVRNIGY